MKFSHLHRRNEICLARASKSFLFFLRNLISFRQSFSEIRFDSFFRCLPTVDRRFTDEALLLSSEDRLNFIASEHFLTQKANFLLPCTEIKTLLCTQFMHTRIFHLRAKKKNENGTKTFSIMKYLFKHDVIFPPRWMTLWKIFRFLDFVLRQKKRSANEYQTIVNWNIVR